MCYRRFEIAARVAFAASDAGVLSNKRERSLGVIKAFKLRDPRPTRGAVA